MMRRKNYLVYLIFLIMVVSCGSQNFIEEQKKFPRVRQAIKEKDKTLRSLFKSHTNAATPLKLLLILKSAISVPVKIISLYPCLTNDLTSLIIFEILTLFDLPRK